MANLPEINLAPPIIAEIGPFPITNTFISTLATSLIIILLAYFIRKNAGVRPSRAQVLFESIMDYMLDKMIIAFGSREKALKFFPLIFTIFLLLLFANQFTLIPFVESIFINETPLFRNPASHYSLPIVMAVVVLLLAHILAISISPLRHIGNFIKLDVLFKVRSLKELPMALLEVFLGLLDIIGEIAKLISLSTRLFGNLFAGSVIVAIIAGLTTATQFLIPIPFIALGILSGVVQAFVFAMLSTLFISSSINSVKPEIQPTPVPVNALPK